MVKYVKLNPSAHIFFDQASKIKVISGEVVELTEEQYNLRAIQAALNNGYLKDATPDEYNHVPDGVEKAQEVHSEEEPEEEKAPKLEQLKEKFTSMALNGNTIDEIKEKFTLADLKALAESYDIIPEDGDTKATLVEAILDELNELELFKEK